MSKFFAMLKDSFKEAIDGWIFLVMMILSGLVILLVASISYEPLPADIAIPKSMPASPRQIVPSDRGAGDKQAIFFFQPEVTDVKNDQPGANPWEGQFRFTIRFESSGFGPAGAEVEIDENKQIKSDKPLQESIVFGNAFREAVRYWAGKPDRPRPEFTEELALEYVKFYIREMTALNVISVTKEVPEKNLLNMVTGTVPTYKIVADGGTRLHWIHQPSLGLGLIPLTPLESSLGGFVYTLEDTAVNWIGAWGLILAGVIVTAGFIPNMLRKGAIDLLLTKPMNRPLILLYKYFGGLLFVFLISVVTIGGIWVVIGLRTGIWAPGFLICIAGITLYFAVLYACSTLVGVLTRNTIVSIVLTLTFWAIIWAIGGLFALFVAYKSIDQQTLPNRAVAKQKVAKKSEKGQVEPNAEEKQADASDQRRPPTIPDWLFNSFKWMNKVIPRTKEIDALTTKQIAKDIVTPAILRQIAYRKDIDLQESLIVSGVWIVFFLSLATLRFVTRSY